MGILDRFILMKKKSISNIFNLCLLVALLSACKPNTNAGSRAIDPVKVYPVVKLTPCKAVVNSDYPATIQGIQNIEIRPKIDGYVEAIYIDEGVFVTKGQLLFKISAPQYDQNVKTAEADIKIAIADVNAAKMQVDKVKPLVDQDIVSAFQLKSAQYTLEAKQAALAQANATLS